MFGLIIFLCLGTTSVSFGIELMTILKIYKDLADNGYKVKFDRLKEVADVVDTKKHNRTFFSFFIPVLNIQKSLMRAWHYSNNKDLIFSKFNEKNLLEEMSDVEMREYLKHPTGLNALVVPLNFEIRLERADFVMYNDGFSVSKIFYECGDSLDDIVILKVEGNAKKLTEDELRLLIVCKMRGIDLTDDDDETELDEKEKISKEPSKDSDQKVASDEKSGEKSRRLESIDELTELRHELLDELENKHDNSTDDNAFTFKKQDKK